MNKYRQTLVAAMMAGIIIGAAIWSVFNDDTIAIAGHSRLNPDVNRDGFINVQDLGILLNNWSRVVIRFNGSSFSPAATTINPNDTVIFLNDSAGDMWPASDPHPLHTGLSGFDPLHAVPPGQVFSYKFTQSGSWGFHDHIFPSASGEITVR